MKFLQPLDVLAVQRPGLAPTEKRCEKNGTADLELLRTIEYCVELSTLVRSLPSAWLALFTLDVISLSREPSPEMPLPRY